MLMFQGDWGLDRMSGFGVLGSGSLIRLRFSGFWAWSGSCLGFGAVFGVWGLAKPQTLYPGFRAQGFAA